MWNNVRNQHLQLPLPVRGNPHAAWENRKTEPKGTTLFYVMDAVGHRKAVSVTFNDARLQSEFERRFRESSMYGKTVSLEKFNRFIRRLKASLEEITDTDLERLRSRLFAKEESVKLDHKIRRFIGIVYQMKR